MKLAAAKNPDLQIKMSAEVNKICKNKVKLIHTMAFRKL
jgi:hypothetical protein